MTLAQFAMAIGATPKWVHNALASLKRRIPYTKEEARVLGLARVINTTAGLSLPQAYDAAARALESLCDPRFVAADSTDGAVSVVIDVPRYLSTFGSRLAVAMSREPRARGRRRKVAADPLKAARDFGIDISLIESNLLRTPEERLRVASENAAFIDSIRGKARRR